MADGEMLLPSQQLARNLRAVAAFREKLGQLNSAIEMHRKRIAEREVWIERARAEIETVEAALDALRAEFPGA